MRWFTSMLVLALVACGGGKAPLGKTDGGFDGGAENGLDAGPLADAGTDPDVDAGSLGDAGPDAGNPDDAGLDAGGFPGHCFYAIWPTSVNFGQVSPGDSFDDGGILGIFTLSDLGPGSCLVSKVTLASWTDPAFSLVGGPIASQWLSGPGEDAGFPSSWLVSVIFTPRGPGTYSGAVTFGISDPTAPHEEIPFSITVGPSCLIFTPDMIDFGTVARGPCIGDHRHRFWAVNGCAQAVTIQSVALTDAGPFVLLDSQAPQTVAQGGTSSPFGVGVAGAGDGIYSGSLVIQTDLQDDPFTVPLTASVAAGPLQIDAFTFEGNYLFVLTGTPDRGGPTLSVNGTALREGWDWSFDPITNMVAIDSTNRTLNTGDQVEISYHLACG